MILKGISSIRSVVLSIPYLVMHLQNLNPDDLKACIFNHVVLNWQLICVSRKLMRKHLGF